jgi:phosphatidylinositol-bisphosphatase
LLLPLLLLLYLQVRDRILWRGKGMKQVRYERCGGYRLSDHRPVRAVFHAVCELVEGVDA